MKKCILILFIIILINLSCRYGTDDKPTSIIVVDKVSIEAVIIKSFPILGQTQIYPPGPSSYNVNEYTIRIDGYKNIEPLTRDSKITVICFFPDNKTQLIPIRASEIEWYPNDRLSILAPVDIRYDAIVGISVATDEDVFKQSHSNIFYFKDYQKIFLKGP
jgi:hypothetical protein